MGSKGLIWAKKCSWTQKCSLGSKLLKKATWSLDHWDQKGTLYGTQKYSLGSKGVIRLIRAQKGCSKETIMVKKAPSGSESPLRLNTDHWAQKSSPGFRRAEWKSLRLRLKAITWPQKCPVKIVSFYLRAIEWAQVLRMIKQHLPLPFFPRRCLSLSVMYKRKALQPSRNGQKD